MSDILKPNAPFETLKSNQDLSVNFIASDAKEGFLEARYVRRTDDYFIVYLSSQSGCIKSCRMCHLTATGQNKYLNSTPEDFKQQAENVFSYYDTQKSTPLVHYNFMARGEPLDNPLFTDNSSATLQILKDMATVRNLDYRFLISTIMPDTVEDKNLIELFPDEELYPEFYYSIYSVNPKFRKKWLPRAINPELALEKLVQWQEKTKKIPKIHFAFIKDENDSENDVEHMCRAVNASGLKVNFNIVRYNSYSEKYGVESSEEVIERNVKIMNDILKPEQYRVVPKVGFDVKASCGMFIER